MQIGKIETIKKVRHMFKGYNKDTRTTSMTNMFICKKFIANTRIAIFYKTDIL